MKRFLSMLFLAAILAFPLNAIAAENLPSVDVKTKSLKNITAKKEKYKFKTVLKHYSPYEAVITNNGKEAILMNAESTVELIMADGSEVVSPSRRDIYRKSRKRDMGRYYAFGIPGAIIAGGITGITFFIGAPLGALIAVGTLEPANKAVRTNVGISQEMYNKTDLPIRMEPSKTYTVRFYIPKKSDVSALRITNLSAGNKNFQLEIPITKAFGDDL